jgi:hypothetical protein
MGMSKFTCTLKEVAPPEWLLDVDALDPDLCRNTMKYRNTHKRRDAAEVKLHFINNK